MKLKNMLVRRAKSVAMCLLVVSAAGAHAADDSLTRVQASKKIVVCSSNDLPYAYRSPSSGAIEGTDIDMLRAIVEPLGVKTVELYEVPFNGLISALNSKRCDVIADNVGITAKRSEQVAFSAPMYRAGVALVTPKGNPAKIRSEADFSGHSVGSYLGTIQMDWLNGLAAKDPKITVKAYKNIPLILAELRVGRLDVAAFDDMVASDALRLDPSLPIEILDYRLGFADYAVGAAFRKDDVALRQAFDEGSRKIQLSGKLREVLTKWGMKPAERYFPFPNCCN